MSTRQRQYTHEGREYLVEWDHPQAWQFRVLSVTTASGQAVDPETLPELVQTVFRDNKDDFQVLVGNFSCANGPDMGESWGVKGRGKPRFRKERTIKNAHKHTTLPPSSRKQA
jgi:hypothetical protein